MVTQIIYNIKRDCGDLLNGETNITGHDLNSYVVDELYLFTTYDVKLLKWTNILSKQYTINHNTFKLVG